MVPLQRCERRLWVQLLLGGRVRTARLEPGVAADSNLVHFSAAADGQAASLWVAEHSSGRSNLIDFGLTWLGECVVVVAQAVVIARGRDMVV
eukprot:CAMPEP_0171114274 /NCGR_PEP_ID=MMETSP0766_2-20121228/84923_1 /TAXON_ID=439317 /ORGANISM="Gambierdiscus australes, Strain CAWD 149" /LENGTH=91 /DNA_ID=CAMNT_0011576559 /DNA_START=44 /DNA_END=315 /DNA_ORIENTATION=+